MAPRLPQVTTTPTVPTQTEVVVIGGGIMGATIALELAERGIPVVMCEKGLVGGEQSSRNMGWVRKMARDRSELPLAIESSRLWEGMNERIGADVGYRRSGVAFLFETKEQLERNAQWLPVAKEYGVDTRALTGDEVAALMPSTSRQWGGALYTASDGRAEPAQATTAIANAAARKGAQIMTYCAVRTVETRAGRVAGVVTENGFIACNSVVIAGGVWTTLFCRNLKINFPQLKVTVTVVRTAPVPEGPEPCCSGSDFLMSRTGRGEYILAVPRHAYEIMPDSFRYFWQFRRATGAQLGRLRLRVGSRFLTELGYPGSWSGDDHTPFEVERTLNPRPDERVIARLEGMMGNYFPAFQQFKVMDNWVGVVDVTPDALPVISPVATLPGLFIVSGFSGVGFAVSPGAGKLAADLVTGSTPVVDPAPFRLERLAAGHAVGGNLSLGRVK